MNPQRFKLIFAACPLLFCFPVLPLNAAESISSTDAIVDSALMKEAPAQSPISPVTGRNLSVADSTRALLFSHLKGAQSTVGIVTEDQTDKRGRIYDLKGDVRIARKGSQKWKKAKKNIRLEEGDMLLTGKNGAASMTFDETYLNVTHIPQNTRAVLRSIEPTDIYLEDGTLYNFFDGLQEGSRWKVSTPTTVAAVRGTHFLANYTAASGQVISAVFDVPEDGHISTVTLIDVLSNGLKGTTLDIPEGRQIDLKAGQQPDPSLFKDIDPYWIEQIQKTLAHLAELRAEQNGVLPPTGGEGDGVNDAMNDVYEGVQNNALNARDLAEDVLRKNASPSESESNNSPNLLDQDLPDQESQEPPSEEGPDCESHDGPPQPD